MLRIVYDGPGVAGKTTNVESLSKAFVTSTASAVFDGGRRADRTQFFECMHVDGGLVEGCRLRTLFVTVPGQEELRGRRLALLDGADAVVFVCDSSEAGMSRAREMYHDLCEHLLARGKQDTPIVVQANKQDLPGALDTRQVARALNVAVDVTVVPARALLGIGVRETAVQAARAAAAKVRATVAERGFGSLAKESAAPEQLLESVRSIPVDTAGSHSSGAVLHALADLAAAAERGSERDGPEPRSGPALPRLDLPESSIWPARRGREVLDRVCAAGVPVLRSGAKVDVSDDRHQAIVFEVGPWWLETSPALRFASREAGERALQRHAGQSIRLDRLLPPRTTLLLAEALDGAHWLWAARPWMRTLEDRLIAAGHDSAQLESAHEAYADAAFDALGTALERGLILDLAPFHLAALGQRVSYLGVLSPAQGDAASMAHAILDELVAWGASPEFSSHCRSRLEQVCRANNGLAK